MTPTFCLTCTNRIHNKARLCLHCLAARQPSRLRIIPSPRMPSLDARLLEAWAYRFQLIEKAGGADLPRRHLLTVFEWIAVFFNPWALLLGPFYFVYLGLWRQALAMWAIWFVLPAACLLLVSHVLTLVATPLPIQWSSVGPLAWLAVWLVGAMDFAVRVNRDFYRQLELRETPNLMP